MSVTVSTSILSITVSFVFLVVMFIVYTFFLSKRFYLSNVSLKRVNLGFSPWNVKGVPVLFLHCWYMQSGLHYFALLFAFNLVRHAI